MTNGCGLVGQVAGFTLYGTGFGPTSPALPSDTLVGAAAPLAAAVTFRIGGTVATVKWAGMIASGLYQFNVQVRPLLPVQPRSAAPCPARTLHLPPCSPKA